MASAQAALKDTPFDLLILDVTLPDGNGVTFCQELRASGNRTPILFLTARDEEFDIVRGLDAGELERFLEYLSVMEKNLNALAAGSCREKEGTGNESR